VSKIFFFIIKYTAKPTIHPKSPIFSDLFQSTIISRNVFFYKPATLYVNLAALDLAAHWNL